MNTYNTKKGFTLIELIIYIAISAMVLVSAINIGWRLINADEKAKNNQEVYYSVRLIVNQLQVQTRQAEDVITASSGVLTLDYPGVGTDVTFDTYTKEITVGGIPVTINKLRIKEGTADYEDLTGDRVDVTNFTLTDLTRGAENKNIKIELTIEKVNPGNDPDFDASISIETALSIRE